MEQKKAPNNSREFLTALSRVFEETPSAPSAELRASLESRGVQVESFLARARALVDAEIEFRQQEHRRLAMKARSDFLSAFDQVKVRLPTSVEGLRSLINEFVAGAHGAGLQQAAVVQWRKFENATEDDLRTLAEDLLKLQELAKSSGRPGGKAD